MMNFALASGAEDGFFDGKRLRGQIVDRELVGDDQIVGHDFVPHMVWIRRGSVSDDLVFDLSLDRYVDNEIDCSVTATFIGGRL